MDSSQFPKVLVVDDEVKMCFTLRKLLELSHFQVDVAHDGIQAMDKVKSFHPQCVLLDIRMPNSNGYEVLQEIKKISPETIVIMTTAVASDESRDQCMQAGAYDYLTKPVNFQTLLEKIEGSLKISLKKV
jgi:DNA-binding response OmpR family regulator